MMKQFSLYYLFFGILIGLFSQFSYAFSYSPRALIDEVKNLPGAENLEFSFRQFSGYLTVAETKHIHYWFVESFRSPETDPIVFWTNGGPGCSGMMGFLTEQGPFRIQSNLSLELNPYAWNKISNMIFVEQPCGVGFSYSSDKNPLSRDYHSGDDQAAIDNYYTLQAFFERFPQFRQNDFYLASESYGGHYIPTLAKQIVDRNENGEEPLINNFKGFLIGNAYTTFFSGFPTGFATLWGHQLISRPLWETYKENCIDKRYHNWTLCAPLTLKMFKQKGHLDTYGLDYPVCNDPALKYGRMERHRMMQHMFQEMKLIYPEMSDHELLKYQSYVKGYSFSIDDYDPCLEDYMDKYLNQVSVKEAIHVKTDRDWVQCGDYRTMTYSLPDQFNDITVIYKELIDKNLGLKIFVYSGDNDFMCSTYGTQSWIWDLGYEVDGEEWIEYMVNDQSAGYITKWKDTHLVFATVHGAGHMVPTCKPEAAYYLYESYLFGDLIPK